MSYLELLSILTDGKRKNKSYHTVRIQQILHMQQRCPPISSAHSSLTTPKWSIENPVEIRNLKKYCGSQERKHSEVTIQVEQVEIL